MAFDEIYVSVQRRDYRINKSNILRSQANLLVSLKSLRNLEILSKQKNDLKKRLHRVVSSTLTEINSLREKLPIVELPKEVKKEIKEKTESKKDYSKREAIDTELKLIQEKLQQINGMVNFS